MLLERVERDQRGYGAAVDQAALFVDDEHAIGIAVERDAEVASALRALRPAGRPCFPVRSGWPDGSENCRRARNRAARTSHGRLLKTCGTVFPAMPLPASTAICKRLDAANGSTKERQCCAKSSRTLRCEMVPRSWRSWGAALLRAAVAYRRQAGIERDRLGLRAGKFQAVVLVPDYAKP